jgi:hypothetical protein
MVKKLLRQILPEAQGVREHKQLRLFGRLLHNPQLWHLHRDSVAKAVSLGLFIAFVPFPSQMFLAAITAIVCQCNLPIAVAMVWITNPLTIPPIFYATYRLGAWLLHEPPQPMELHFSLEWLLESLGSIWVPLLLGSFLTGLVSAVLGYVLVQLLWRLHVVHCWQTRKLKRIARQGSAMPTTTSRIPTARPFFAPLRRIQKP